MAAPIQFLFATCQCGAEAALKSEIARLWPDYHLAYSRPGFLTFKLPTGLELPLDFDLKSVFARAYGFSLGKADGNEAGQRAQQTWDLLERRPVERVHVWQRDHGLPGEPDPGANVGPLVETAQGLLLESAPPWAHLAPDAGGPHVVARPGELILDCILVEEGQWWVGFHRAGGVVSRWPGGAPRLVPPADMVSRAWLKMEEALRWSELPIPRGARCAEIGSAPGGASQALLGRGLEVIGIDPAEMDPRVLSHRRFRHIRRRVNEVRRREFRKVRWLTIDMNVAPAYTLEVAQSICQHPEANIRGMLLTLKLFDPQMAEEIPTHLRQIRSWGYNLVRARQLFHNRQEVCVAALQKPFRRKGPSHRR